jgi:hypothetical protein
MLRGAELVSLIVVSRMNPLSLTARFSQSGQMESVFSLSFLQAHKDEDSNQHLHL